MSIRKLIVGTLAGCALLCAPAYAQYPNKSIRIIVPFEAGGAVDAIARIIADGISGPLGEGVIIENRAGGGSIVGTAAATRAAPDGYTLLMGSASGFMITPLLQDLPYDPMQAFEPVALVGRVPFLVVSSAELPPRNYEEFVAYAKSSKDQLGYASAGPGTPHHVAGERFSQLTETGLMHIPYKGTQPGLMDVISGRVAVMNSEILAALPQVRSGKLVALGIAAESRNPIAPDIPTLAEAGLPDFYVTTWYGLMAPTGVAPEILDKLATTVTQALQDPKTRARLDEIGVLPGDVTGAEFAAFLNVEGEKWTKAVRDADIRLEYK